MSTLDCNRTAEDDSVTVNINEVISKTFTSDNKKHRAYALGCMLLCVGAHIEGLISHKRIQAYV